eukprot:CAMPEP_0205940388 /NCGR_PEP_ID=MMETSP1325-20131115/52244_1 /ASSEMBLY_ACC=CAM_ASM_000708 /TAXON_ID=236786 /ORGANISM="Florenciella sp., Strain RCC1007" /LENGTH=122 /DNA_ID=CAMNT_0053310933 /DNA_START=169 /DNA_END=535 /DNA_ORIENTATION=-
MSPRRQAPFPSPTRGARLTATNGSEALLVTYGTAAHEVFPFEHELEEVLHLIKLLIGSHRADQVACARAPTVACLDGEQLRVAGQHNPTRTSSSIEERRRILGRAPWLHDLLDVHAHHPQPS